MLHIPDYLIHYCLLYDASKHIFWLNQIFILYFLSKTMSINDGVIILYIVLKNNSFYCKKYIFMCATLYVVKPCYGILRNISNIIGL